MSMNVKYEVIKTFKYGGEFLKPGDEFIPGQGKYDNLLIADDSKYVRRVEMKPIPKRRSRAKKVSNEQT